MELKRIFAGLLAACFLFVQVIGPSLAVEIEHAHYGDADHDHNFAGHRVSLAETNHHDHEHAPSEPSTDTDELPNDDSTPASHTHVLSLTVDVPIHDSTFSGCSHHVALGEFVRPNREPSPDDPSFKVIKPPQLV